MSNSVSKPSGIIAADDIFDAFFKGSPADIEKAIEEAEKPLNEAEKCFNEAQKRLNAESRGLTPGFYPIVDFPRSSSSAATPKCASKAPQEVRYAAAALPAKAVTSTTPPATATANRPATTHSAAGSHAKIEVIPAACPVQTEEARLISEATTLSDKLQNRFIELGKERINLSSILPNTQQMIKEAKILLLKMTPELGFSHTDVDRLRTKIEKIEGRLKVLTSK